MIFIRLVAPLLMIIVRLTTELLLTVAGWLMLVSGSVAYNILNLTWIPYLFFFILFWLAGARERMEREVLEGDLDSSPATIIHLVLTIVVWVISVPLIILSMT